MHIVEVISIDFAIMARLFSDNITNELAMDNRESDKYSLLKVVIYINTHILGAFVVTRLTILEKSLKFCVRLSFYEL